MSKTDFTILGRRKHSKASEEYVDAIFNYAGKKIAWSIPIEYRRTGTDFSASTDIEIEAYINEVYELCEPSRWSAWKRDQDAFWLERPRSSVTKSFFDALAGDFIWKSVSEDLPPNRNPQRRIQDLKEFGFTLATNTAMKNPRSGVVGTHHVLLPIPRGGITGYEVWSPALRKRIIAALNAIDAYENSNTNVHGLLPDHKFPEIRWDSTVKRDTLENLSDAEILQDFQLLTNQRNQQKRESCRKCFQTSQRPGLFGLKFYAKGSESWPDDVPTRGKAAEQGCVGCGWYDIAAWRLALQEVLATHYRGDDAKTN